MPTKADGKALAGWKPLVVFGCNHIGAKTADLPMMHRYIKFVEDMDAMALLIADNHECAIPRKGSMMLEQNMTPQEQLDYGIEAFRPIKHRIIGACTGNHANRAYKEAGLEMDKIMADTLGYSDRYFTWQGFVGVKVGKVEYRIAFKHGSGGGSDDVKNARQLFQAYPTADICVAGHTHRLACGWSGYWDVVNGKRVFHPVCLISTGSMLDYPRYADEASYQPQRKGFAILWLNPNERQIIPDTSGQI